MEEQTESPDFVRLSLAATMQLGYSPARFYRGARMTCINILLTYANGCAANCSYCGLARERQSGDTFIRVPWPAFPTDDVIERIASNNVVKRTCVSMVTNARSLTDAIAVTRLISEKTNKPVSVLVNPTTVQRAGLQALLFAGADRVGVAFDLATHELFEKYRGKEVRGPHRWDRYWSVFRECVDIFGPRKVGSHFITGLGETESELVEAMQMVYDLGGVNHLFSFFPEQGSVLEARELPPMEVYRRIQIAAELIDSGASELSKFKFDEHGRIMDFGISPDELDKLIDSGKPFRTRGCVGKDGEVACNRPYANSLPGDDIRNYPFAPESGDIARIRQQLFPSAPLA